MSNKLYEALGKVINSLDPARKTGVNPHFNSSFADLNGLLEIVLPALDAEGLTMVQLPVTQVVPSQNDLPTTCLLGVKTVIMHAESDSSIESEYYLPCKGLDPQKAGSCITYSKRYAIKSIFCMRDTDDDGNAASKVDTPKADDKQTTMPAWLSFQAIGKLIGECTNTNELNGIYKQGIESNPNLNADQSKALINQARLRKETLLIKGTE